MTNFEPNFLNLEYFFYWIYRFIVSVFFGVGTAGALSPNFVWWLRMILAIISSIFLFFILHLAVKIMRLRGVEKEGLFSFTQADLVPQKKSNEAWEKILKNVESDNEADWKVAIIEADKILDEMLKKMQYAGDDLGERLRAVEVSDFTTLEDAWEAHRVRNKIAHEAGFLLTKREAKRVVGLFENVFREFDFI